MPGLLRLPPLPSAAGDLYVRVLAFGLVCYAVSGKGFAYVGVPPLFVGEILFGLGLLVLLGTRCILGTLGALPNLLLLVLGAWTLCRTVPFLPVHGLDAVRDSVIVFYGGFAFIVCGLLVERPERLETTVRLFSGFAAVIGAFGGVFFLAAHLMSVKGIMPSWPNSPWPLIGPKAGDIAVHMAGSAVFALLFFKRTNWLWIAMLVMGTGFIGAWNRGGMLAILVPVGFAILVSGRIHEMSRALVICVLAGLLAYLLGLELSIGERDRPVSVERIVLNAASIVGETTEGDLDGTKQWRLLWWEEIVRYTFHGPHFWTGKGFGLGLAEADGFAGAEEPVLRSPHNVHITMLARAGVPGFILWLALLASWFALMFRNMLKARRRSHGPWANLFLFIACYLGAAVVNASFDVALEGPMLGIWFWVLFGFGVGASLIYRTHCAFTPEQGAPPRRRPSLPLVR